MRSSTKKATALFVAAYSAFGLAILGQPPRLFLNGEIARVAATGKKVIWKLTIPPNTKGELPLNPDQLTRFRLDGQSLAENRKVHASKNRENWAVFELPSGSYEFEISMP